MLLRIRELSNNKVSAFANKFIYTDYYLLLILTIGALGFMLRLERLAIIMFLLVMAFNLIFIRDMMPNFAILIILAMTPLARYAQDGYFYPLKYVAPIAIVAFVAHLIIYKPEIRKPKFLLPTIAVAFAITLGGLFSPYYLENFEMPALYYVFTLGVAMVGVYLLFEAYIPRGDHNTIDYFARIMVIVGLMGIIMVITNYSRYGHLITNNIWQLQSYFQFGNNLSNNLLISMPFAFYLSLKGKRSYLYFTIGMLQYFAMVFSLSRGGIIFSTLMMPFIVIATIHFSKEYRLKILINLLVIITILAGIIFVFANELGEHLLTQIQVSSDEARANLYRHAWQKFLEYPVFGTGLGYDGGLYYRPQVWCIYWYHSTIFQIIASLGVLGLICYGYQYFVRLKCIFSNLKVFNLFLLFSFSGFEAYSMVNVGNFAPLPFVVMIIVLFIISDRYNYIDEQNSTIYMSETITKPVFKITK